MTLIDYCCKNFQFAKCYLLYIFGNCNVMLCNDWFLTQPCPICKVSRLKVRIERVWDISYGCYKPHQTSIRYCFRLIRDMIIYLQPEHACLLETGVYAFSLIATQRLLSSIHFSLEELCLKSRRLFDLAAGLYQCQ